MYKSAGLVMSITANGRGWEFGRKYKMSALSKVFYVATVGLSWYTHTDTQYLILFCRIDIIHSEIFQSDREMA